MFCCSGSIPLHHKNQYEYFISLGEYRKNICTGGSRNKTGQTIIFKCFLKTISLNYLGKIKIAKLIFRSYF